MERLGDQAGTVYEVRLRGPDGREVSRRFRTKADAANYEAAQVTAKSRGTWVDPTASSMTFAAAAEEWMASNPAKRASSLDRDRSALRKHLLPPLGHRRIGAITKPEVQALVNGWTERLEPRSVHCIYGTLRAVLNYAVDRPEPVPRHQAPGPSPHPPAHPHAGRAADAHRRHAA